MPVEQIELTAGDAAFSAELEFPESNSDHGAVLLPGAIPSKAVPHCP